jgi:hypothetical protein
LREDQERDVLHSSSLPARRSRDVQDSPFLQCLVGGERKIRGHAFALRSPIRKLPTGEVSHRGGRGEY